MYKFGDFVKLFMIHVEITKFLSKLAWINPLENWNHIKIFMKLGGSFKNQVRLENDYRPGISYVSIAHVK